MAKVALDKRKLIRELERERQAKASARLRELRTLIGEARRLRRDAIGLVRDQCRTARVKLRENCARRLEGAKVRGAERVTLSKAELERETRDEKLLRAADRRGLRLSGPRSTARERRAESDDEVISNIPEALASVFARVKRHIKNTPRKSRTEAFLEWAQENPGEVYAIQAVDAERELAKLIAEHERTERLARGGGRRRAGARKKRSKKVAETYDFRDVAVHSPEALRPESFAHLRAVGQTHPGLPVTFVIYPDGLRRISDGRHRITLARERGDETIEATVLHYGPRLGVKKRFVGPVKI